MTDPKFSIIIPTYNRSDLIMETLETVFAQSYRNYEVIVVDNCSTDNTAEILRPLSESGKIRYIIHDRNYERSKSRNTGMQNATGDFVTFLDSDDFIYPNFLQDAADFHKRNPEIKFFQSLYELVNNNKERIYSYKFPSLKNQYLALASGNFISCIAGFLHRELYQQFRFDENPAIIGTEDYEVWFKLLARYKMGRINKVNAGIREHPHRSVNQGAYDNLQVHRDLVVEKIKADPVTYAAFKPYLKRLDCSFLLQQVVVSNGLQNKKQSMYLLRKAIKTDPSIVFTLRFIKVLYNTIKP